jgi:hypothetical protein
LEASKTPYERLRPEHNKREEKEDTHRTLKEMKAERKA